MKSAPGRNPWAARPSSCAPRLRLSATGPTTFAHTWPGSSHAGPAPLERDRGGAGPHLVDISPMLLEEKRLAFSDFCELGWIYEMKLDGYP
jgi:hypothetical protein